MLSFGLLINPDPITCPTKVVLPWAKVHLFRLREDLILSLCVGIFLSVSCVHAVSSNAQLPVYVIHERFAKSLFWVENERHTANERITRELNTKEEAREFK